MSQIPAPVAEFLAGRRLAVTGVSRSGGHAANGVFRKLRAWGYDTIPINPRATQVEGVTCYPDLASAPGPIDGVVIATHPDVALGLIQQCAARGIPRVWFHRSFGSGSVSVAAVEAGKALGVQCIVGGCPLMYREPVDVAHRCMRWWLRWRKRVPG